jgi:hypothetical protein
MLPMGFSEESRMIFQPRWLLVAASLMASSCTAPAGNPADPNVPGATGRTIVIGNHSSMAGSGRVHPDWGAAATTGN